MQALVHALPELLPMIQTHLLDLLSLGLTRKPYRENLPTATAHSLAQAIQLGRPLFLFLSITLEFPHIS